MFRKRRERKTERLQAMRSAVADRMDQIAAEAWEWGAIAEKQGEAAASLQHPLPSTAHIIAELLPLVDNDVGELTDALADWYESRLPPYEETGDEYRASHIRGLYMAVGINGVGNFFGFIPEQAPAFDAGLASEGRARGWRR
jgi:hypothetical protein